MIIGELCKTYGNCEMIIEHFSGGGNHMARNKRVVSRKEYTCNVCGEKIEKGVEYVNVWNYYSKWKVHTECFRKTPRSRWESSEYTGQVYDIQDDWYKYQDMEATISNVEDLLDDLQSKFDNMPEQLASGSLVEERIDTVTEVLDELNSIYDEYEQLEELDEDATDAEKEDYENEKDDIISRFGDELDNLLY